MLLLLLLLVFVAAVVVVALDDDDVAARVTLIQSSINKAIRIAKHSNRCALHCIEIVVHILYIYKSNDTHAIFEIIITLMTPQHKFAYKVIL